MQPLTVLLVSTSYPRNATDWRARFIADMVESLAARDDLEISVWAPPGELPPNVRSALSSHDRQFLDNMTAAGGIAHLLRSSKFGAARYVFDLLSGLRNCYRREKHDILHINWLQNALPLPANDASPVLITVLGSDYRWLSLPGLRTLLRHALRGRRAHIAPNAEWMVPRLSRAFGDIAEVSAIPFGIEQGWYSIEREESACDSGKWLGVTRVTRGKIGHLFEWGASAFTGNKSLHLLGPHQEENLQIPGWVNYHGPTFPEALKSDWMPRAAGLISLSQHDEGRPQVMLEAMAAGLPIIASDLPAHRDIVRHGETGFLVSSQQELQKALEHLSVPSNNRLFGDAARAAAIARYGTWQDCAERYMTAYRTLMDNPGLSISRNRGRNAVRGESFDGAQEGPVEP